MPSSSPTADTKADSPSRSTAGGQRDKGGGQRRRSGWEPVGGGLGGADVRAGQVDRVVGVHPQVPLFRAAGSGRPGGPSSPERGPARKLTVGQTGN